MTSLQLPHEAIKHNLAQVPNESIGGRQKQATCILRAK